MPTSRQTATLYSVSTCPAHSRLATYVARPCLVIITTVFLPSTHPPPLIASSLQRIHRNFNFKLGSPAHSPQTMVPSINTRPPSRSFSSATRHARQRSKDHGQENRSQARLSSQRSSIKDAPEKRVATHPSETSEDRLPASTRNDGGELSESARRVSSFIEFARRALLPTDPDASASTTDPSLSNAAYNNSLTNNSRGSRHGQPRISPHGSFATPLLPTRPSRPPLRSETTELAAQHGLSIDDLLPQHSARSRIENTDDEDEPSSGLPPPSYYPRSGRPRSNAFRETEKRSDDQPLRRPRPAPEPPFRDPFEIIDDPPLPQLPDSIKGGAKFRRKKAQAALDEMEAEDDAEYRPSSPPRASSASFNGQARLFPLPPIVEEPRPPVSIEAVLLPRNDNKSGTLRNEPDGSQGSRGSSPVKQPRLFPPAPRMSSKELRAAVHAGEPKSEAQSSKTTILTPSAQVTKLATGLTAKENAQPNAADAPSSPPSLEPNVSRPLEARRSRAVTVIRLKPNGQRKGIPSFTDPAEPTASTVQQNMAISQTLPSAPDQRYENEPEPSTQLVMKRKPKENGRTKRLVIKDRQGLPTDQATSRRTKREGSADSMPIPSVRLTSPPKEIQSPGAGPSGLSGLSQTAEVCRTIELVPAPKYGRPAQPKASTSKHDGLPKRSVSFGATHWPDRPPTRSALPRTHSEHLSCLSLSGTSIIRLPREEDFIRQRNQRDAHSARSKGGMQASAHLESGAKQSSVDDVPDLTRSASDTFSDRAASTPAPSSTDLLSMGPNEVYLEWLKNDEPGKIFFFPRLPNMDDHDDEEEGEEDAAAQDTESSSESSTPSRLSSFSTFVGSFFPFLSPSPTAKKNKGKSREVSDSPIVAPEPLPPQPLKPIPTAEWPSGSLRSRGSQMGPSIVEGDMRMTTFKGGPPDDSSESSAGDDDHSIPVSSHDSKSEVSHELNGVQKRRKRPSMKIKIGGLGWPSVQRSLATTALTPNEATCDTATADDELKEAMRFTLSPRITSTPTEAFADLALPSPAAPNATTDPIDRMPDDKTADFGAVPRPSIFEIFANLDAAMATKAKAKECSNTPDPDSPPRQASPPQTEKDPIAIPIPDSPVDNEPSDAVAS